MRPNNLTLVKVKMSYNKPRLDYVQKVIAVFFVIAFAYLLTVMANVFSDRDMFSLSPMFSSSLNNERVALEETTTDSTYEKFSLINPPKIPGVDDAEILNLSEGTGKTNSVVIDETENEEMTDPLNYYEFKTGWTSGRVNVRDGASLSSNIYEKKCFNTKIEYASYNEKWAIIKYDGGKNGVAFMSKMYITDSKPGYIIKSAPSPNRKSYMYYQAITNTSSKQYALQMRAYTNSEGLRMLNGRYMIALGSNYTTTIGQYVDIVLANGTVIECILSDAKSDRHTDSTNSISVDGSVAEFIVDTNLNSASQYTGDVSSSYEGWDSPVTEVIIYDKVV